MPSNILSILNSNETMIPLSLYVSHVNFLTAEVHKTTTAIQGKRSQVHTFKKKHLEFISSYCLKSFCKACVLCICTHKHTNIQTCILVFVYGCMWEHAGVRAFGCVCVCVNDFSINLHFQYCSSVDYLYHYYLNRIKCHLTAVDISCRWQQELPETRHLHKMQILALLYSAV